MYNCDMTSKEELVDALSKGIIQSIQCSGKSLPSSSIHQAPSEISDKSAMSFRCEWIEYATDFCSPVVEDLRRFFPRSLMGTEVGSDGRPLLYATCLGLLLSKRNDSSNNDKGGKSTPLSTFLSIASFLLDDVEVNPNQPTLSPGACHRPSLHLIARSCHPSAVQLLLSKGADLNKTDREGWTALMACCMPDIPKSMDGGPTDDERVETMMALLNAGDNCNDNDNKFDVDARNYCGYTALHYACEGLNPPLIRCLLVDGGADATLRTVWGQTCLGIVRSMRHKSPTDAQKCDEILMSHLKKTRQIETISSFLDEELKAINLLDLVHDVLVPASRTESGAGLAVQDRHIVTALLKYLDLDPNSLYQSESFQQYTHEEDANLYEEVHRRLMKLIPIAYQNVYRSSPSSDEREIITGISWSVRKTAQKSTPDGRRIDNSIIMRDSFRGHRERGHVAQQLEMLNDLIVGPLQRTLGFGIPGNAVIREIVALAPKIVEMGAGTGYWSYVLSKIGADVVAYDAHPADGGETELLGGDDLTSEKKKSANEFLHLQSYFPVREGVASTVFGNDHDTDILHRALLMVWPNNPDAEDNQHVAGEGGPKLPDIWDIDCLEWYHQSGVGDMVIYVGEREAKIELMHDATGPDCGFCSSRKFQTFLQEHYELVAELECPRWWMKVDDVTVWKRK